MTQALRTWREIWQLSVASSELVAREKLSAIVTSFNEEINIQECLESLSFADEVLLVDSYSTDRTLDLARRVANVRILQREYFGSAAQKNWAMDQTIHPWVLIVDADERVTPGLAREIGRASCRERVSSVV